jgi:hypothetical protein
VTVLVDQELLVILNRARTLLSDAHGWSSRYYAEDQSGRWVPVGSSAAVRFNLEGALVHAAGRDVRGALPAIFELFGEVSTRALARLKATPSALTYSEAVSLLDESMAKLSSPGVPRNSEVRPLTAAADDTTRRDSGTGDS